MSLISIAKVLAKNVGMAVPDVVITSPFREWQEATEFANETGEELARRVDWGQLQKAATLTGDGTDKDHALPGDLSRFSAGVAVRFGVAVLRPLTRAEWNTLVPVVGVPRYFLKEGDTMRFWPFLANAATVSVSYQSKDWSSSGQGFMADTDTSLIDEDLMAKGLIVRWRRQKGMDYADWEAEYEAAIQDFAMFNDRSRI
jgi:hypothetical protein